MTILPCPVYKVKELLSGHWAHVSDHLIVYVVWAKRFLIGGFPCSCMELSEGEIFFERKVVAGRGVPFALEQSPQGFVKVLSPCGLAYSSKICVENICFLLSTYNLLLIVNEGLRVLLPIGPF